MTDMLENIIMTDIKVNPHTNTVERHLRGIGTVHSPKSYHRFPSRSLSQKRFQEIKKEIENDPELSTYELQDGCWQKNKKGRPVFNILHLKAPICAAKKLKTSFGGQFITGNYSEEERLKKGSPHTKQKVSTRAVEAIKLAQLYNADIKNLRREVSDYISKTQPKRKQAFHTRVFNELNRPFLDNAAISDEQKEKATRHLPEEFVKRREALEAKRKKIEENQDISTFLKAENLEVLVKDNLVEFQGHLTADEILKSKWAFFDLEIPHYKKKNPQISWVGVTYYEKGSEKKELHTLSHVDRKEYEGYRIVEYATEEELVNGVALSIRKEDPLVVSAFNNEYDFIKMVESSGTFDIGEEGKSPLQEVATKFFKRIGVKGRLTVDLLRFAQLCYDYLPNKKLELVSKVMLKEKGLTKNISYEEMEVLEYIARGWGTPEQVEQMKDLLIEQAQQEEKKFEELGESEIEKTAARLIARYVAGDVDVMPKMFASEQFKTFVDIATHISAVAAIPLQWSLYSPRSVQYLFKRSFFDRYGTHKENLFWNQAQQRKEISKAKQFFAKLLDEQGDIRAPPGLYENVHVAYIKYGHQFQELLARTSEGVNNILNMQPQDSFSSYVLARYGNALADWLTADYGMIKAEQKKFTKHIIQSGLDESQVNDLYWNVFNVIKKIGKKTEYIAFMDARIAPKTLKNYITGYYKKFIEEAEGKDEKEIERNKEKRLHAITLVLNAKRRMDRLVYKFNEEFKIGKTPKDGIAYIDNRIARIIVAAKRFAQDNNLQIIHQDGAYMYFNGDISTIKNQNVFIASIDRVLITHDFKGQRARTPGEQRLYYNLHNVFKGVKVVNHPSHYLTMFEMNDLYRNFLNGVFVGQEEQAIDSVSTAIAKMHSRNIHNCELVEYSKASERYSAFENGQRIYFTEHIPRKKDEKGEELEEKVETFEDEQTGRTTYIDNIHQKERYVYVMGPQDFTPDWELYEKRFKKKVYDLVYCLLGKATDTMYEKILAEL